VSKPSSQPSLFERAFFRESPEGGTVFFPFGLTHRGVHLPDEAVVARARRAVALLWGGTMAAAGWTAHALQPLTETSPSWPLVRGLIAWPLAAFAAVLLGYALWAWRFVERFPPSDLQVSREERLREAAELSNPWGLVALGLGLAVVSGALKMFHPKAGWVAPLGVATGLFLAAFGAVLLRIRSAGSRSSGCDPDHSAVVSGSTSTCQPPRPGHQPFTPTDR
jgi:hypothetical protein